jgi:hypothetical protein
MKKSILVLFLIATSISAIAQTVNCEELMAFVKRNGREKATVSSLQLFNSSWLKEVKAYDIENTIVVIASIKKDEYTLFAKDYVFCGIPSRNWDSFYNSWVDIGKTYGEKFHLYIIDYICDCN